MYSMFIQFVPECHLYGFIVGYINITDYSIFLTPQYWRI